MWDIHLQREKAPWFQQFPMVPMAVGIAVSRSFTRGSAQFRFEVGSVSCCGWTCEQPGTAPDLLQWSLWRAFKGIIELRRLQMNELILPRRKVELWMPKMFSERVKILLESSQVKLPQQVQKHYSNRAPFPLAISVLIGLVKTSI